MARIYRKPQFIESAGTVRPTRIYHFGIVETADESVARSLASSYLGPVVATPFGVLYRGEITTTQTAYNQWDADVEYIQRPKDIGSWSADIDFTGGTEHVLTSLETVASYPAGTAPNFKQFIGVEPDEVKGTDIPSHTGRLTVEFTHPAGFFSMSYAKYLGDIVNYVNSGNFLSWSRGEVRFLGPRGHISSDGQTTMVYMFEISKTKTNFDVGDITVTEKEGWDVAWVLSEKTTNTVSGTTYPVTVPKFVYIERVSPRIDFPTAFGFG